MPEHWEVKPLGYLAHFLGGATPDKGKPQYWDGEIPWVSPKDMKHSRIRDAEDHISVEGLHDSPLSMIPPGAVLIVVRGMILAHSFPVALTEAEVTINQDMKALRATKRVTPAFLFWALSGFWKTLVWQHTRLRLWSIDRVGLELARGNDDLSEWVKREVPANCFQSTNADDVLEQYAQVMVWAQSQSQFRAEAIEAFARAADAWLIAYARARGRVVVTQEVARPEVRRRVLIPNVCAGLGVRFVNTFDLLRSLGAQFDCEPVN